MATQKKFVVKNGLIASGLTYPTADGTANQVLITDGSNTISFVTQSTTNVSEGSNLYYTNARADARIAAADTNDLSEGSTNLYYTDARVATYISGNRTYGNITTTGTIAGPATLTLDPAGVGDNTGTVVIAGNLQVDGTQTTINSTALTVDDLNITVASGAANAAAANGAGITVDGASATLNYASTGDKWVFNKAPYYSSARLLTTADEGTGNSLDADTVDGKHFDDIISEATALAIALG